MTKNNNAKKREITLGGIKLKRQNHEEPNVQELNEMLKALRRYLDDEMFVSTTWFEDLHTIIEFQDEDGSFKLVDSYEIPSDVRVEYCHMPTYIGTGILMKAFMKGLFTGEELNRALAACCHRELMGHGYDGFASQVKALQMFMQCGLREFLLYHKDFCPAFSQMMERIARNYIYRELQRDFRADWDRDFEQEIREISHYFSHNVVFVYGTLLQGESNHDHYLKSEWLTGRAVADGFKMYDIGYFPGIIPGDGKVLGELYEVPADALDRLDMLEGEGSLYIRHCTPVTNELGDQVFASIYIYNDDVDGLEQIPEDRQPYTSDWNRKREKNDDYVWYVSYGSNMLRERFLHYIRGGAFEGGGAYHEPCEDTSAPLAVRQYDIPYDMYFRNCSGSWGGQGVSFLDITKAGHAKGVAYLITREQFGHVACQENGGCEPEYSSGWYDTVITIGTMGGYEVVTITNGATENSNRPSDAYIEVLCRGLQENYPEMTTAQIVSYLVDCESHGV